MEPLSETPDRAIVDGSLYGIGDAVPYSGALSMFRRRYTKDLEDADIAISGIPYDLATVGLRQHVDDRAGVLGGLKERESEHGDRRRQVDLLRHVDADGAGEGGGLRV